LPTTPTAAHRSPIIKDVPEKDVPEVEQAFSRRIPFRRGPAQQLTTFDKVRLVEWLEYTGKAVPQQLRRATLYQQWQRAREQWSARRPFRQGDH